VWEIHEFSTENWVIKVSNGRGLVEFNECVYIVWIVMFCYYFLIMLWTEWYCLNVIFSIWASSYGLQSWKTVF